MLHKIYYLQTHMSNFMLNPTIIRILLSNPQYQRADSISHINGLVQNCGISSAYALEIPVLHKGINMISYNKISQNSKDMRFIFWVLLINLTSILKAILLRPLPFLKWDEIWIIGPIQYECTSYVNNIEIPIMEMSKKYILYMYIDLTKAISYFVVEIRQSYFHNGNYYTEKMTS